MQTQFTEAFNAIARDVHETARAKGWYDNPTADELVEVATGEVESSASLHFMYTLADKIRARNDGEMIALMHSELSEALEAIRHGNPPDDKIPEFSGAEAELADVIIRIMDMSHARGWRVGEAIIAKMEMNRGRAYKHGGKAF